jgi:hypothetical protein
MSKNGGRRFYDNYETFQKFWENAVDRYQDIFSKDQLKLLTFEKRPSNIQQPKCMVCGLPIYKNRLAYRSIEHTNYYADRGCALWLVHEVLV